MNSMQKMNKEKKEIIWNIINSFLAGALVMLGSFAAGNITMNSFYFAVIAGLIAAITQFRNYWVFEKKEYCNPKLFNFIKV